jgi:hypothetical protein
LKLIEQPSSCRHCKETARGLVSYRQRPVASPRCIRFERIEHAENNARALARIPAGRRRGKQRRPTKPDAHAQTPRASRGTLSDRWSTRPRRRSCDRIRPENGPPARSDVAGAGNGNGRRRLPGRVLMGPEQIQRRFLPIGRTGVPLGAEARAANPTLVNGRHVEIWDATYSNYPAPHVVFRHRRRRRKRTTSPSSPRFSEVPATKASAVSCPSEPHRKAWASFWMIPPLVPPGLGCWSTAYPVAASPKRTVEPILAPERSIQARSSDDGVAGDWVRPGYR